MRWTHYLERLYEEPGIIVTVAEKRSGKYHISGLRDPLASDTLELLKEAELEPEEVIFNWEPYYSLSPQFILSRIRDVLEPPETVVLNFENGVLHVSGTASHQWMVEARKLAKTVPWVTRYQDSNVMSIDVREIEQIRTKVEKQTLLFDFGSAEIVAGQADAIQELVGDVEKLFNLGRVLGRDVHIEILGHADSVGTDEVNVKISQERADKIFSIMVSKGFNPVNFTAVGIGSKKPFREEITEQDRELNRRAIFRVNLAGVPKKVNTELQSGDNGR